MKIILTLAAILATTTAAQAALPTSIVFKAEPLCAAAHKLAELCEKQLYCPADVKGTVELTYNDANPTKEKFDKLLKALLAQEGYGILGFGVDGLYTVQRQRDIKDANISIITEIENVPDDYGIYTAVIQLKHYNAEMASRMLRNFMPPNTRVISDDAGNKVILTAYGAHIIKLYKLAMTLDTPGSAGPSKKLALELAKRRALEAAHPQPPQAPQVPKPAK